jgi:hypothetical protein
MNIILCSRSIISARRGGHHRASSIQTKPRRNDAMNHRPNLGVATGGSAAEVKFTPAGIAKRVEFKPCSLFRDATRYDATRRDTTRRDATRYDAARRDTTRRRAGRAADAPFG